MGAASVFPATHRGQVRMRCAAMRCVAVRGAAVIAMRRGRATAARGMHRTDEERDWTVERQVRTARGGLIEEAQDARSRSAFRFRLRFRFRFSLGRVGIRLVCFSEIREVGWRAGREGSGFGFGFAPVGSRPHWNYLAMGHPERSSTAQPSGGEHSGSRRGRRGCRRGRRRVGGEGGGGAEA